MLEQAEAAPHSVEAGPVGFGPSAINGQMKRRENKRQDGQRYVDEGLHAGDHRFTLWHPRLYPDAAASLAERMRSGSLHGDALGTVNMLVDISERRQSETQQKLLLDELNHRVKTICKFCAAFLESAQREASTDAQAVLRDAGHRVAPSTAGALQRIRRDYI